MDLNTETSNGILVAAPEGRIDGINALQFQQALNGKIDDGVSGVVIDMSDLNYISSAGLRAVLLISKSLQQREARLVLCSLQAPIREVFQISGFDQIIDISEDRDSAIAAMDG
ncbi:MAG: STAS domain-containing protein [Gammaproteobacteria bacterium]|nr:STAS domain-containing protein [Gammaproteobacteria bacterium]MCY4200990.1 STAS domain-containing protein [Gammaproteobacteria bacterium]MCY4277321.1 STAS domain-containing protein [Gammaproteobacteria bacterium]MCY4323905.1 STAS domain-containing protein [Gammaproteobacteria bacterium]